MLQQYHQLQYRFPSAPDQTDPEHKRSRLALRQTAIVVLSFLLERFLAIIFEHRVFIERLGGKGAKEPIAFGLAFLVCWHWDFDAISMINLAEKTSLLGAAITAGVIAGGSKASIKLFRDVLGFRSTAEAERLALAAEGRSGAEPAAEPASEPESEKPTSTPRSRTTTKKAKRGN